MSKNPKKSVIVSVMSVLFFNCYINIDQKKKILQILYN